MGDSMGWGRFGAKRGRRFGAKWEGWFVIHSQHPDAHYVPICLLRGASQNSFHINRIPLETFRGNEIKHGCS